MRKKIQKYILIPGLLLAGFQSCYYDNEEDLYPDPIACDTTNVTYTQVIAPIMSTNCNSCHGGPSPSAGVKTDTYEDLKVIADNGRLWGTVNHDNGYVPMPYNRPQMNDCDLLKIRTWLDNGALDD